MAKHRDLKTLLRTAPLHFHSAPAAVSDLKGPATLADQIRYSAEAAAKPVSTMAPKKVMQIPLKSSERFEASDDDYIKLRPSQLVARIADINNPGIGYQRPPRSRMKKLLSIARKFDKDLLGLFHAWINQDGELELLDALGRCFVCLNLLKPAYDEPVLVKIHRDVKNVAQAAIRFLELNPDEVAKVNDRQKFLARLTAKETLALSVQAAAEMGGLVVGGHGRNGISVQAAEALFHMGVLTLAGLVKINGKLNPDKLTGPQWIGLGGHILATGDNSNSLRDLNLLEIERRKVKMYGDDAPHARVSSARYARAIYDLRVAQNSRRKDANKVANADWSKVDKLVKSTEGFGDRWGFPGDRIDNPKRKGS